MNTEKSAGFSEWSGNLYLSGQLQLCDNQNEMLDTGLHSIIIHNNFLDMEIAFFFIHAIECLHLSYAIFYHNQSDIFGNT